MYADTHATRAYDFVVRASTTEVIWWDNSTGTLTLYDSGSAGSKTLQLDAPDVSNNFINWDAASGQQWAYIGGNYTSGAWNMGTAKAGGTVNIASGNNTNAVAIDSSQNTTLASDLTLSEGKVSITDTANELAFLTTSSATTANAAQIVASSLTTGSIARFYSNSSSASTRNLIEIVNDNTAATGATVLTLQQDAQQEALRIDLNANDKAINVQADSTTDVAVLIQVDSLTTGAALQVYSDSSATDTRDIVEILQENASASGATALRIKQDAAQRALFIDQNGSAPAIEADLGTLDAPFLNFVATADADTTSAISTNTTSGATTHHVQVEINGTKAWIAVSTNAPS